MRLRIVDTLRRGPHCVCEIQSLVGPIAPNLLSYHLSVLRAAGLVAVTRRGRWLDYRLEVEAFRALRRNLPLRAGGTLRLPRACPPAAATTQAPAGPTGRPRPRGGGLPRSPASTAGRAAGVRIRTRRN